MPLARPHRLRARRGFSLVELLVSLILLQVAVLGLVSVSALAVQRLDEGQRRQRALTIAVNRMEVLRAQPCADTASAGTVLGDPAEWWSVSPVVDGPTRELSDSVVYAARRGEARVVLRGVDGC